MHVLTFLYRPLICEIIQFQVLKVQFSLSTIQSHVSLVPLFPLIRAYMAIVTIKLIDLYFCNRRFMIVAMYKLKNHESSVVQVIQWKCSSARIRR